jgi:hypothetical protein
MLDVSSFVVFTVNANFDRDTHSLQSRLYLVKRRRGFTAPKPDRFFGFLLKRRHIVNLLLFGSQMI